MTIIGPTRIIKCPHCFALVSHFTLLSGNTGGATVWTDGYVDYPMFPRSPYITKCHNCAGYYWRADAEEIGELPFRGEERKPVLGQDPDWANAPRIKELDEDEYWAALASGTASTTKEEKFLRILAWWRSNDPYRDHPDPAEITRSSDSILNLERLIELLSDSDEPRDMLFNAEVFRQLGRFDESIAVLELISATEVRATRDQITQLASENWSGLARLEDIGSE